MSKQHRFHNTEVKIYLVTWVSGVLYAMYHFTVISQKYFQHFHDSYNDFSPGWSILNFRKRDKADFEWETISYFLNTIYPITIIYLVVSETLRYSHFETKHQQYFQIFFPIFYLAYHMGYKVILVTFFQPVVFYLASTFNSKVIIWVSSLTSVALITIYKQLSTSEEFLRGMKINHFEAYLNILLLCWLNLKCTSYYLSSNAKRGLLDFLSYCLYIPTLFTGPFIPYEDFKKNYKVKEFESFDRRIKKVGSNILRCLFWYIFANFCLHYIYVNATSFQVELVSKLDLCSICGYGYLMGQFFHIKYVCLYGFATSLAAFENIPVPCLPRCIGRVHLYSDMWKFFDPGLYTFLKMCIFIPSQNVGVPKWVSSLLCFSFVYIWHGVEDYILVWAALNFIGVTLESLVNTLYEKKLKSSRYSLKENNLRRLKCVLTSPLLAMSAISNFYFFAGMEVGNIFVQKAIYESSVNKLILLFMLYCCCHVSMEVRDVNAHRM